MGASLGWREAGGAAELLTMTLWHGAAWLEGSRSIAAWLSGGFGVAGWVLWCLIRVVLTWQPFLCSEKVSVLCSISASDGIHALLSPVPLCHSWMNWVEKLPGEEGKRRG